jgi:hypothetical protein
MTGKRARILIGKLHEAWKLFKTHLQAKEKMREDYLGGLTPSAAKALEDLNKHFGRKSLLTEIRNKLAFHYTDEDELVEANFQRLSDNDPWEFYLGVTVGNSFYFPSEMVVTADHRSDWPT